MHAAEQTKMCAILRMLLEKKADVNQKSISVKFEHNWIEFLSVKQKNEVIHNKTVGERVFLLQMLQFARNHYHSFYLFLQDGKTAIMFAAEQGNGRLIKAFVEHKANPDMKNAV